MRCCKFLLKLATWLLCQRIARLLFLCCVAVILVTAVYFGRLNELARLRDAQKTWANLLNTELDFRSTDGESRDVWRAVDVPDGCIFSAYLDARPEIVVQLDNRNENVVAAVRIVAVLPLDTRPDSLDCVYRYEDGQGESRVRRSAAGGVKAIDENWGMKYSAFFVLCNVEVPRSSDGSFRMGYLPSKISIGRKDGEERTLDDSSFVDIRYPEGGLTREGGKQELLAVCVPAFHHRYDRSLHLIEFIEYYRMLGASHFTFYESSVTRNVQRVLRHYSSRGNVTVLRWKLHPRYVFEKTLRVDGIFAALNDCLYRSSFHRNYKYVAGVDVDEFIVPRIHDDFRELLDYLDPEDPEVPKNKQAAFLFPNAYFYTMYDDDTLGKASGVPYLYTQAKTERVLTPNPTRDRSKYIVRGEDVVELGNHNVWEFRGHSYFSKFSDITVDVEVALSHHYRACESDLHVCYEKPTTIDRTAHKYIRELGERVSKSCREIFGSKGCPAPKD